MAKSLLHGAKEGDEVVLHLEGATYQGLLVPKHASSGEGIVVLKLSSGYNIGIEAGKIRKVEIVKRGLASFGGAGKEAAQKGIAGKENEGAAGGAKAGGQKNCISLLGCGGTIASKVEYKTGAVYPASSPQEIMGAFPSISKIAQIKSRVLFQLLSEDMTPQHWSEIAAACKDEIKDGADGLLLMHGTDTMGYTSAALSFMLQDLPVPVVLTGSQRSTDRPSTDADVNMKGAMLAAKGNIASVMVCMHKDASDRFCSLHLGTRVRKQHTSRRDAFVSVNSKQIGEIDVEEGKVNYFVNGPMRDAKRKLKLFEKVNGNVALVWIYPGMNEKFVKSLGDFDGVVLAGSGLGHAPVNAFGAKGANSVLPALEKIIDGGTLVAMAPQTIYGRVNMGVYTTGRLLKEAGVIGDGCDWLPEAAYAKMCWALGQEKKAGKAAELMLRNVAGEISERSEIGEKHELI